MISSRDIITVLTNPNTAVNRGRTMYLLDQAQRSGANPAITDLLSRLTARPVEAQTSHQHPANATKPRDEAPLTPADLMWLDRLPRNPEDVSHRDAIQLATLAQSVGPIKHPADARPTHTQRSTQCSAPSSQD